MVKINEYIESGILEAYVLGSASESETRELLQLKAQYPQIQEALFDLELDLERIAQQMAVAPPPQTWSKIETEINELAKIPRDGTLTVKLPPGKNNKAKGRRSGQFIEVESASSHMRVHKIWRWVLIFIFILGKIFLGFALYFYLENRQMRAELEELKQEIRSHTSKP